MKKQKKWIRNGILFLIFGGFVGVVISHPYLIYIAGELIGVHCDGIELVITELDVEEVLLEDLPIDESMLLINKEYTLEGIRDLAVSNYQDTEICMNECMQESFGILCKAVKEKTGADLKVSSDYRSLDEQVSLYREDRQTAITPGSSEHQAGLALDLYVEYFSGYGFLRSEAGTFVNSCCSDYGFIIRYPVHGMLETGIKYEPWHIRYVGLPHSKIIYENHMTLETYIESLEKNTWYEVGEYYISRQNVSESTSFQIPAEYSEIKISSDNTGSYIITIKK